MKVLSLFDGMSCGRIALDQLGIPVETYYASEIDKYAIQVSQANYPDIIQVGDICDLDPKDYMDVDLMLAGSPCQGFSFAGKQLAFNDPRSALFFEFIRLLKAIKPKYFLLENVRMKKEFLQVISEQVSECYPEITFGIEPIFINSSLLSAQSRQRYYWTNIPGVKQPEDKGMVLRDILETETDEQPVKDTERNQRHYRDEDEKSLCMTATMYKGAGNNGMTLVPNKPIKVGMNVEQVKIRKHEVDIESLQYVLREMKKESGKTNKQIAAETELPVTKVEHWFRTDSSFAIPGDDIWPVLKEVLGIKSEVFDKSIMEFEYRDGVFESTQRVYSDEGKSPTLTASNTEQMIETKPKQVGVAVDIKGHDQIKRVYSPEGKSPTVTTCGGGHREPKVMVSSKRHEIIEKNLGDRITDETLLIGSSQKNAYLGKDKSSSLTEAMGKGGGHVPMVRGGAIRGRAYDKDGKRMDKDGVSVANKTTQMLELRKDDKSNAITTVGKDSVAVNEDLTWRKLTPLECERLQTVPDNYTNHVSNTYRYKMLGNGWTVEVIKHIFNSMEY